MCTGSSEACLQSTQCFHGLSTVELKKPSLWNHHAIHDTVELDEFRDLALSQINLHAQKAKLYSCTA